LNHMSPTIGILFALGALFGWALGDFSIQRAVRAVGNVHALFYIGILGAVGLLPFVWNEIVPTFSNTGNWPLMAFICLLIFFTALVNFQTLKLGKLSVVMPINGIELVIALLLAAAVGRERYAPLIYGFMLLVALGLILTSVISIKNLKRMRWEKGVAFAFVGAMGLGASDYFIGQSSRVFSPLFTNWLIDAALALGTFIIILKRYKPAGLLHDLQRHFNIIASQSLLDNLAWISFAYSATYIPIGIASAVSEGYLALGAMLGVLINKERLRPHQYLGIGITIFGVLALSLLTAS